MPETAGAAHVLVFPYPAHGHMIPLLDLTRHLAFCRLTITIVVTPKNLPQISPLLADHPSITPLVLPFPAHPAIPSGVENTADLPSGGFLTMILALSELHDPLTRWFRSHPSPPAAIISDMFLGWTNRLASELGIRRYCFSPSGAFAISVASFLWKEMPKRRNLDDENELVHFPDIPNTPAYPWWQLSPVFRSYKSGNPNSEFIRGSFLENMSSSGMIFNTFTGLESSYLDYLSKVLGHEKKVWSVGPLLPPEKVVLTERGGLSSVSAAQIISWLDSCEDHTVVYVCFGSQAVLTNKQMEELALGLEKSGVKFILSTKSPTKGHLMEGNGGGYGATPAGFKNRVAERGLVIEGWAPQLMILKHRAVNAFLTHCGWNSTLESIVAGVPMLAWAMSADQFIDATLLVEQLDVAVKVCEGAGTVPESDDLARLLEGTMGGEWAARRDRAVKLSGAALKANQEGGSSFKNLKDLVSHLSS